MTSPPAPSSPNLDVRDVRVLFGTFLAVKGVSFALHPGELMGLIGSNGAGKTTLLRALCGLQPTISGKVHVNGVRLDPHRGEGIGRIGFTPDTPPVYEDMTVRHFLEFIGRGHDMDRAMLDEKISFWLDQVWLRDKADQKIKSLSRGMRQRLGIARTLLPDPDVILLDEPAAGLDPAGRVQFRELLVTLRRMSKTLIVSSHILADMHEYCSHIGIMAAGKLLKFGTVAQIGGANEAADVCEYQVELAAITGNESLRLREIEGLSVISNDGPKLRLRYANGKPAAARLLGELIARGLPVARFTESAPNLEAAYLREGIRQVD